MAKPTDAVILMAGAGSRLRTARQDLPKPLVKVGSRPLISHVFDRLIESGIQRVHAVVGWERERLLDGLTDLTPNEIDFRVIYNPDWNKQNGISLLCAEGKVTAPFLLTMADHLFDLALLDRLIQGSDDRLLNVAVDSKLAAIFDLEDAMKVQIANSLVTTIGKNLTNYDAIDTGVFLCSEELFHYLREAIIDGDCALADGVRIMAAEHKVRAVDIGDAWWQDVDTPAMLKRAEEELQIRLRGPARDSLAGKHQTHDGKR